MMRFGNRFSVELFGSSHGPEVGAIVRGLPEGFPVAVPAIQSMLDRRRAKGRSLASRRGEEDRLVIDGGIRDGKYCGPELRAHVDNQDVRREDYRRFAEVPRPGHADFPARTRYGPEADLSGGGIFSGRMTIGLVIGGAVALQLLAGRRVQIVSFTTSVGPVAVEVPEALPLEELRVRAGSNEVGCPDGQAAARMEEVIATARRDGDSVGGTIETRVEGLPVGVGEPFFDSIESVIAHLAFAVPAVKGIEFGAGFRAASMRGSEHNDTFYLDNGVVKTRTNSAGGVLGGLANGMPVRFRVAVKPTSSIARPQETLNLRTGGMETLRVPGRHDPCIVPRAVVVLEAVTAIGLADLALQGGFLP